MASPSKRERSKQGWEGGITTLQSAQPRKTASKTHNDTVRGMHSYALSLALCTPPPLAAICTAAAALPMPRGRSGQGPATRLRRARQLSWHQACGKRAWAPTPVIKAGMRALTVVWVGWHTHLQCSDGLRRPQSASTLPSSPTRPPASSAIRAKVDCAARCVVAPAVSL